MKCVRLQITRKNTFEQNDTNFDILFSDPKFKRVLLEHC
jgi:hypothetical protein